MFLVHPTLSEQDMRETAQAVEKVLQAAAVDATATRAA
jgi:ribosomal protein S6